MKTDPTPLDIEAAALFRPAPGMRALLTHEWCRVVQHHGHEWTGCAEDSGDGFAVAFKASEPPIAFDMDDPATQGAALAQIEDAAGTRAGFLVAPVKPMGRVAIREVIHLRGTGRHFSGLTIGEALVAAMRAVKK